MHIRIKPLNAEIKEMYTNHNHHHDGDAGIDLYVIEDMYIPPKHNTLIPTGIICEPVERKHYFLVTRSSICKTKLRGAIPVGVIDSGYRGEILFSVDNISDEGVTIKKGDRLCQLISSDGSELRFTVVDEVSSTERGSNGLGSTGGVVA